MRNTKAHLFAMCLSPSTDAELYARLCQEENISAFLKRCVRFYLAAEKRLAEMAEENDTQ